ncbi:MAG TPA: hypothetical protein VIU61_15490 [Kofleriaceae bacterium]
MELARGSVSDRPWGQTFGALGLRGLTGQLTLVAEDGKQLCVAFERGAIVGATSPLPTDSIIRVALTSHLISPSQVAEITRKLALHPDRDEIDVLVEATALPGDQAFRLRQRLIAQRAARTFAIDRGQFVVDDEVTITAISACAVDVRAIVYLGVRMNLPQERLVADLRQLGSHFVLRPEVIDDIPQFGLTPAEGPILDVLRHGTSLPELEATHRELDPRTAQSVIYALVTCGACEVKTIEEVTPRRVYQRASTNPIGATPQFDVQLQSRTTTTAPPPTRTATTSTTPPLESRTTTGGIAISRSATPNPRTTQPTPPRAVSVSDSLTVKPTPDARTRTTSIQPSDPISAPRSRTMSHPALTDPSRSRAPSGTPNDPRTRTSPSAPPISPGEIYAAKPTTDEIAIPRTVSPVEPWMTIGTPTDQRPALARARTPMPTGRNTPQTISPPRSTPQTIPPQAIEPPATPPEPVKPVDPIAEAAAAFARGQSALRTEDLDTAVRELSRATELHPAEVDYFAMLAWARFCATSNKATVADDTRKALGRAILKSHKPELARFYLGRVERMLGRDREALRHFNEVLDLQPRNAEAASEKRILELRIAASNDKSGLFRKR